MSLNTMANELQVLGFAIAAVKVVITAAKRIANAKETYQEIINQASHVDNFLNITRAVLDDVRKEKLSFPPDDYESCIQLIKTSVETCERLLSETFGLRDKQGQLRSELKVSDRLILAAKDGTIQRDRDKLAAIRIRLHDDISIVSIRLSQIRSQVSTPLQGDESDAFARKLRELRSDTDESNDGLQRWRTSNRALGGDEYKSQSDEQDPNNDASSLALEIGSRRNHGSSTRLSAALSASNSRTRIFSERSRDSSYQAQHTGVETLTVLESNISIASEDADRHIDNQEWNSAAKALGEVINRSELREQLYGVPFDNRFQVHEDLAIVYLRQEKWAEALKEIPQLHRRSFSSQSDRNVSFAEEDYLHSRSCHLRALIHWDRYYKTYHVCRDRQTKTYENEKDLDAAKDSSLAAYGILESHQHGSQEQREELRQCLRLLIRIYQSLDNPFRASVYRRLLEHSTALFLEPMTRRVTITSELMEDSEEVETERVAQRLRSGGEDPTAALFAAVKQSKDQLLKALVNKGEFKLDLNAKDDSNCPLLNHAVQTGRAQIVHFLLEHDANPNCADDSNETPLLICVKQGYEEIARTLIDHKADCHAVEEDTDWTLVHHAIRYQSTTIVELLLNAAPKLLDAPDAYGKTPLHHCAEGGDDEATWLMQAEVLLKLGANVNAREHPESPRTPLFLATSRIYTPQRAKMVELLVNYHADVDRDSLPPRARDYKCLGVK